MRAKNLGLIKSQHAQMAYLVCSCFGSLWLTLCFSPKPRNVKPAAKPKAKAKGKAAATPPKEEPVEPSKRKRKEEPAEPPVKSRAKK